MLLIDEKIKVMQAYQSGKKIEMQIDKGRGA